MRASSLVLGLLLAIQYQQPVQPRQQGTAPWWVRTVPPMGSSRIPTWDAPPLPPVVPQQFSAPPPPPVGSRP